MAIGAAYGAIGYGAGIATQGIGTLLGHGLGSVGTELVRATAHGLVGGGLYAAQGGNFWQGFGISAVSSLAGSGMQALKVGNGLIALGTGAAGAGMAWATGGNPINGFMQGFNIGMLNHAGEQVIGDDDAIYTLSCDDVVILGKRSIPWISQFDSRVPHAGNTACKRACYMMVPYALQGMGNGYFVARESGHSFVATQNATVGYQYLDGQLSQGARVIVGVGRHADKESSFCLY
ncbi:MAG: hypothetical protein LBR66_04665 [Candidatus Symbiothrix sp.]|nr:hypothetical protein [Candidatus Symbiothrix sp.]